MSEIVTPRTKTVKYIHVSTLAWSLLTVGLLTYCYLQHVFISDLIATRDADRESRLDASQRLQALEERIVVLETKAVVADASNKLTSRSPWGIREMIMQLYGNIAGGLGSQLSGQGAYGGVPLNTHSIVPFPPIPMSPASGSAPAKEPKQVAPTPKGGPGIDPL